ncbi:molybdopterin-dependent oxidoreductase [Arthrobacter sp. MYb213]|uniref:molybdopterin-dependent oxidoreductase n=1 Tax=Arthrobacter sp. MYb213 TaxID=1848595 RepID=UPI000CFD2665|nr:molybdopterin-dependent oxidoreductase [Arthrobacter sp. MYb213]PRB70326.1 oxidoreductase [Arthrobacter sp. MYb213]
MDKAIRSKRFELFAFGLAGFISAAVLFSVAQLLSVFFATSSAPFVALGSTFIDFTPPWLKDFAIATFGTNDKLALFISLGVVSALLAASVGLLARRSLTAAVTAILILSAVIGASVITRSATGPMDLVPLFFGTVFGLGTLKWLTTLAAKDASPIAEDEPATGFSRRKFLVASSLSVLGAAIAAGVGTTIAATRNAAEAARLALGLPAPKIKAAKIPTGAQVDLKGMPQFVTPNEDFYRIDTALSVPRIDPAEWSLRVHGMVDNEFTMSFDELLREELVESYLTLTCVSNPVGGDLVGNAKWLGYPLRKLLERAVPQAGADMVLSTSIDGFSASTPLEILTDDRMALLAVGMNDEPLPLEHGFPVRMVVPGLYGYVSATKWVVDLEVTRFGEKDAYWTTRGWSERGPIKMSSRVDVPRSFSKLPVGEVVFGGTAWAQTIGISKVEIQIDDEPWQRVELAKEATLDTWRQWRYVWKGGTPGNHSVTVRAYNTDGEMQTSDRADPVPNGASGWQRVQFSISDS